MPSKTRSACSSATGVGHVLRGRLRGLRSLRVGSYRVLYELTDREHTVRVAAIRHRATAYRIDPR